MQGEGNLGTREGTWGARAVTPCSKTTRLMAGVARTETGKMGTVILTPGVKGLWEPSRTILLVS